MFSRRAWRKRNRQDMAYIHFAKWNRRSRGHNCRKGRLDGMHKRVKMAVCNLELFWSEVYRLWCQWDRFHKLDWRFDCCIDRCDRVRNDGSLDLCRGDICDMRRNRGLRLC